MIDAMLTCLPLSTRVSTLSAGDGGDISSWYRYSAAESG